MKGIGFPSVPMKRVGVAAAGAVSRPSIVSINPVAAPWWTRNPPPPMPLDCGSTTVKANIIAIAASVALPPFRRISRPASLARGSAEVTTPWADAGTGRMTRARATKRRLIMPKEYRLQPARQVVCADAHSVSMPTAWPTLVKPSRLSKSLRLRWITRASIGPSYTNALYIWTSDAPARMRA